MPVNQSRMKALVKQYGKEKGEEVYYALEAKEKKKERDKRKRPSSDPIRRATKGGK